MYLNIHPENPEERKIDQVVQILKKGGVIIYPTDTVYGIGCDIRQQEAIEKVCKTRGLKPEKAALSMMCKDISQVAEYTAQIDTPYFKILKSHLPGPFTFILNSNHQVPKLFKNKKRTVGIRIPDSKIILALIAALGAPILTTSLKSDDEILEYFTDPSEIYEDFEHLVDLVIDGGPGGNQPSTIIDLTQTEPLLIRQGAGLF
jgi:tRNA threonylcarbamoyl adenosine modification protein (Sua5/YciO/YrdC/YwlC family)